MGISAIPFAVDLDKVKRVFGSKDRELMDKIKAADLYDHYANQSDDFLPPEFQYDFDEALEDIVFNYIKPEDRQPQKSFFGLRKSRPNTGLNESIAHGYGYVLLVICDALGTYLMPGNDGFYYGKDFKDAFLIMKEHGLKLDLLDMFESHSVFDIPKINDFPAICHYSKQDIEQVVAVFRSIEIDEDKAEFDSPDFDEVQMMLKDTRDVFTFCKEKKLDLVTFTH